MKSVSLALLSTVSFFGVANFTLSLAALQNNIPDNVALVQIASGLDEPVFATTFPGDSELLVVCQKGSGRVTVHPFSLTPGVAIQTPIGGYPPMLDLVSSGVITSSGFQGLTGLAFHPRFKKHPRNRWVFVRYNTPDPQVPNNVLEIIERFYIPTGSVQALTTNSIVVYSSSTPSSTDTTHLSGQIHFDQRLIAGTQNSFMLYAARGDGSEGGVGNGCLATGFPGQTWPISQEASSDLGKLLRFEIDVALSTNAPPLRVAKGLRNPFGFSVDLGAGSGIGSGDVYIGDTGSGMGFSVSIPGDIHLFTGGHSAPGCAGVGIQCPPSSGCPNYGWPYVEGVVGTATNAWSWCSRNNPYGASPGTNNSHNDPFCSLSDYELPIWSPVSATNGADALLGGYVHRGSELPGRYFGRYFYALFGNSSVQVIDPAGPITPADVEDLTSDLEMTAGQQFAFGNLEIRGLGQDENGELFILRMAPDLPNGAPNGIVYRVVHE